MLFIINDVVSHSLFIVFTKTFAFLTNFRKLEVLLLNKCKLQTLKVQVFWVNCVQKVRVRLRLAKQPLYCQQQHCKRRDMVNF